MALPHRPLLAVPPPIPGQNGDIIKLTNKASIRVSAALRPVTIRSMLVEQITPVCPVNTSGSVTLFPDIISLLYSQKNTSRSGLVFMHLRDSFVQLIACLER
jgi:hypothetical protein